MYEMSDDELNEIEARANNAAPGPWKWNNLCDMRGESAALVQIEPSTINDGCVAIYTVLNVNENGNIAAEGDDDGERKTMAFIAHSRTDIDRLIAEVRRLRAARGKQPLLTGKNGAAADKGELDD